MSDSLEYVELGTCLECVIDHRGKTPRKFGSDWVSSGIPTISANNVNGGRLVAKDSIRHVTQDIYRRWMKEDVKRGDCLLVSEGATLGECMLWDDDYPVVLGQRLFCLRPNPERLYSRYLIYYMTSSAFQSEVRARATGTSVDGLRQTEVMKLKIRLLPIKQQRMIGDTLYDLDKKIELNRRMNETLEGMARALFKSWFVDFDPVRAKAALRREHPEMSNADLSRRALPSMAPEIAELFPDAFEDSSLGKIPTGWRVDTIGAIANVKHGFAFKGEFFSSTPTENILLTPGNFAIGGGFKFDKLKFYNGPVPGDYELAKGTLLVSMTDLSKAGDTLGYPAFVPQVNRLRFLHNQRLGRIIPLPDSTVGIHFLFQAFCRKDYRDFVLGSASGSTVRHTSPNRIMSFTLVVPTGRIGEIFEIISGDFFEKTEANMNASRLLGDIRDTLIPKLLSGVVKQ